MQNLQKKYENRKEKRRKQNKNEIGPRGDDSAQYQKRPMAQ
jgi:hypothetical protein